MKTSTSTATATQATTPDPTKLQNITNSSGVDIQVALPVTTAESSSANSIVSYTGDLEILPVTKGGRVITNGTSDTVLLDRTHKDTKTGQTVYSMGYDLIISSSTWLLPIANISVVQDYDDDDNDFFDPVIVPATAKAAMQQAADFYQTIAAYPDSQLAKDYIAAMTNTSNDAESKADGSSDSSSNVDKAISGGVSAFFKSTKSYQQVTLANIVALQSYYNRFPFAWAQYSDSVSYFLYSSDGTKTSFQGKLTLSKTGAIDITKVNGGYTCQFLPAVTPTDTSKTDVDSTKAKTITYSGGVFVDDASADIPAIAVKGTFQLKRTFTKDPDDTKIIVVMSGTINGQKCIGFDSDQATKADDTTQDWLNSLFHPKTAAEIFNSVMQILGALMMLHFVATTLFGMGKWIKEKIQGKEPVTKDDLDTQKSSSESDFKASQESALKKVSADKDSLPDSAENGLSQAADAKSSLSDQVSAAKIEDNLMQMKDNLKAVEPFAAENADQQATLEQSASDIRDAYTKLTGEVADLKATLAELRPQVQTLSETVTKLNTDISETVSEDQKAEMDENVSNMNDVKTELDDENQTAENEEADAAKTDPEATTEDLDF